MQDIFSFFKYSITNKYTTRKNGINRTMAMLSFLVEVKAINTSTIQMYTINAFLFFLQFDQLDKLNAFIKSKNMVNSCVPLYPKRPQHKSS